MDNFSRSVSYVGPGFSGFLCPFVVDSPYPDFRPFSITQMPGMFAEMYSLTTCLAFLCAGGVGQSASVADGLVLLPGRALVVNNEPPRFSIEGRQGVVVL